MPIAQPADGSTGWGDEVRAAIARINAHDAPSAAVSLSPLPGLAAATWEWNGVSWSQDNVVTDGNTQYAVWVNDAKTATIAKRTLPDGAWQSFDLAGIAGTPFGLTSEDGHCNYALGVDSAGYVHVSGNQHGGPLRYVRSATPGDITAWTTPGMVGTEEDLVTYPRFFRHPDGTMFLHYRNGVSVNGDNFLNRYNTSTSTWTRVAKLTDGTSTSESCYDNRIVIDSAGVMHYSFAWKSATTYNDINDIGYMQSPDKGVTWRTITGVPVTVPITHPTAPTILDTAANGSGIANQFGMDVDSQGRPHMATFFFDGTNRQINHLWWTGSAWRNDKATQFALTGNDFTHWPSRPAAIFCHGDRVYIPYRYQYEGKRGSLRMLDVTPGRAGFDDFPILDVDLREWEGSFDSLALRDRGELTMLVGPMNSDQGSPRPEYWADDNWLKQWVGVLTIDLDRLPELQARTARLPTIRTVGRQAIPALTTVTSTSLAVLPSPAGSGIITPPEVQGKLVVARLSIRGNVSAVGTTLTVLIREFQQGGGNPQRNFGTVTFTITTTSIKTTPWIPLVNGPRGSFDAFVDVLASAVGGGTGTISYGHLELGVLDCP